MTCPGSPDTYVEWKKSYDTLEYVEGEAFDGTYFPNLAPGTRYRYRLWTIGQLSDLKSREHHEFDPLCNYQLKEKKYSKDNGESVGYAEVIGYTDRDLVQNFKVV